MTAEQIESLDLAYAPPLAPVYDPVLIAAGVARKELARRDRPHVGGKPFTAPAAPTSMENTNETTTQSMPRIGDKAPAFKAVTTQGGTSSR